MFQEDDGGELLFAQIDFPFVTRSNQAQRLAKIALFASRQEVNVALPFVQFLEYKQSCHASSLNDTLRCALTILPAEEQDGVLEPERLELLLQGGVDGLVDVEAVDLDADLSSQPGPGRHPLPEAEEFAATLGRLGISPEDEVVVYDDAQNTIAARLWWMLTSIGHDRVRVLDGGFDLWLVAPFPN